jgi:alkylhydroperoxidase/carboxymuconolactone decarboxylase family protein YurZ
MRELEDRLRRLSIHDAHTVDHLLGAGPADADDQALDPHVAALVRLGVLIAVDGPAPAFEWATASALAAGATAEELVGVLVAAGPLVGSAHVVSVAPRLARALGYDIDEDLERLDLVKT